MCFLFASSHIESDEADGFIVSDGAYFLDAITSDGYFELVPGDGLFCIITECDVGVNFFDDILFTDVDILWSE